MSTLTLTGNAIVVAEAQADDGGIRYVPIDRDEKSTNLVTILCAWLGDPPHPATVIAESFGLPYCELHDDATSCEHCDNIAAHAFPHDCDAQPHQDWEPGVDAQGRCGSLINCCGECWDRDDGDRDAASHDHAACIRELGRHARTETAP